MAGIVSVDLNPGSIIGALAGLIDELFTTDDERNAAKLKLVELEQQGRLAQIEVNKTEAASNNVFVAGWRPFIGWICGLSLGWTYLGYQVANWVIGVWFPGIPLPAIVGQENLLELVLAMLGVAGLRTYEKVRGMN